MKLKSSVWMLLVAACGFNLLGEKVSAADVSSRNMSSQTEAPKPPGDKYTNSVDMLLLKVSGNMWAGKYEVTQKEFQKVMQYNPSAFAGGTRPVDSVTWNEAMDFCHQLTDLEQKKKALPEGYYYTLPTENEWMQLAGGAGLDTAVTSLNGTTRSSSSTVGSLAPNSLGLCDVRGNVMEFCLGDDSKPYRVLKGGSWEDFTEVNLRPEFRWYCKPDERKNTFGFRCVLKKR